MSWKVVPVLILVVAAGAVLFVRSRSAVPIPESFPDPDPTPGVVAPPGTGTEVATFGSGCFWCTEAVFERVKGVTGVVSGYSGGEVTNPTYEQICTGRTGHAEVVQVTFDPAVVSYPELLHVFWRSHDPTTQDRQGADRGPQYRSVIFYHTDAQKRAARDYRKKIDDAGVYPNSVVTQIEAFTQFYPADVSHQDYFRLNPGAGYCRAVIGPKLDKLKAVFPDKLKADGE